MTPTKEQLYSALNSFYGPVSPTDVIIFGTGVAGPVGVPVTIKTQTYAYALYGDTVTEERTLQNGSTSVLLTKEPESGTVIISSIVDNTIVYDTLQGLTWSEETGTFLPITHLGQDERRTFFFTYSPVRTATDIVSAVDDILPSTKEAVCIQVGGSHGSAIIPTANYTLTCTVTQGSTDIEVSSIPSYIVEQMVVCFLEQPEIAYQIVDIDGTTITLSDTVQLEDGEYTITCGGALVLVTLTSGLSGTGYAANIYSLADTASRIIELTQPRYLGKSSLSFSTTNNVRILDVMQEINARARLGQCSICATAILPYLSASFTRGAYPLSGATVSNTSQDWIQQLGDVIANTDMSQYQIFSIPICR